jgi:hypothetical protein
MAVLEEGLYAYLSTYAGLTSLISTRVYPLVIPQGATLPCLTYQRISTNRSLSHDSSGIGSELTSSRFQFDAWATTALSAKAITDQVRAALNGKKGTMASVTIQAGLVDDEQSLFEPDTKLYRSRSDFFIWNND